MKDALTLGLNVMVDGEGCGDVTGACMARSNSPTKSYYCNT